MRTSKIQNGHQGPQNGRWGLPLCFRVLPSTFFDTSTPSMRKVDAEKKKEKEKIMSFLVATNVVASWPPERQLTEKPHARANLSR